MAALFALVAQAVLLRKSIYNKEENNLFYIKNQGGDKMRLQKFFSDCGVLSRRATEAEIAAGKVKVNGVIAQIGDSIDPEVDVVEYKGKRIMPRTNNKRRYIVLNKPRGYVTTMQDEKGRPTVADLTLAHVSIPLDVSIWIRRDCYS